MTCGGQHSAAVLGQFRHKGGNLRGIPRLRKTEIEEAHGIEIVDKPIGTVADLLRKVHENFIDLPTLFRRENRNFVVGIHNRHGFDKHRSAAGRGIVHKTGDVVAAFRTDGQNVTVVTDGDDGILEILPRRTEITVQYAPDFGAGVGLLATDIAQGGRCGVGNLFGRREGGIDGRFQRNVGNKAVKILGQSPAFGRTVFPERTDDAQKIRNGDQLRNGKGGSVLCPTGGGNDIFQIGKGRSPVSLKNGQRRIGLLQGTAGFPGSFMGLQPTAKLLCGIRNRVDRKIFQNLIIFK